MPWCEPCGRYLTPNTVNPDGSCPTCGAGVEVGSAPERPAVAEAQMNADVAKVPWHFWLLLALAAAYLGWRAVQGVALLF